MLQFAVIGGSFCFLTGVLTGVLTYLKSYKNSVNRIFALFSLSYGLTYLSLIFWLILGNNFWLGLWPRFFFVSFHLSAVFFLHLVISWLEIHFKHRKEFFLLMYLMSGFWFFASSLPGFASGFKFYQALVFSQDFGYIFFVYVFNILVLFFGGLRLLAKNYAISFVSKKAKIKFFYFAIAIYFFSLVNIALILLQRPMFVDLLFLSSLAVLFPAYAIRVHHVVELIALFRRFCIFFSAFLSVAIVAVAIKYWIIYLAPQYGLIADLYIILCAVLIFPWVKRFFFRLGNKYVFWAYYDSRKLLASLDEALRSTLSVGKIYEELDRLIDGAFRIKGFSVFSYSEKFNEFNLIYNRNFQIHDKKRIQGGRVLDDFYFKKYRAIVAEEMIQNENLDNELIVFFKEIDAGIVIPISAKDKISGFIVLGQKVSGNMYDNKDLSTLEVIASQASMAIENALMYQRTNDFNIELEKEVSRATRDLREANEELKRLDGAKSEFISIASHQLRTPLTVIKGYISMILEGTFGTLPEPIAESLKKVYDSNERLILLVENLLNITRIESGNLRFDFRTTDLEELVISSIDEMRDTARKNNSTLIYAPSGQAVKPLMADASKIRHVIMNMIENATKYSKRGEITLRLTQDETKTTFSITDSGIGIPANEMPDLFRKFFRGALTPLIHTEGTGLGLYVAKQIVEAHGGRIWAQSAGHEKGATFYFSLPRRIKNS